MIWKILIIISFITSLWAAWASYQNTKAIASIFKYENNIISTLKISGEKNE